MDGFADALSFLRDPTTSAAMRNLQPDVRLTFCHDIALTAQSLGDRQTLRTALDEYGRAFAAWKDTLPGKRVVVRCPYIFNRIGEMAANLGALARLKRLGWLDLDPVLLCDLGTCNAAYLEHWKQHFEIFTDEDELRKVHGDLPRLRPAFLPVDGKFQMLNDAFAAAFRAEEGKPLLIPNRTHGHEMLVSLGLPRHAWFACLHTRSPAYLQEADDAHNNHRNSDVRTFEKAALAIAERGGWTVRIGSENTEPLMGWPNTIDLPHLVPFTDWLDVYVMGACRFFLGDGSGPQMVAAIFDRPLAIANIELGYSPIANHSLHAPKLFRKDGRLLTITEATELGLLQLQHSGLLAEKGVEVVDNEPEDIEAMVGEVMSRKWPIEWEHQYSYRGAFPQEIARAISLASPAFLQKHEDLWR